MLGLRWFNRHARWEREIDAYVDAELPAPQRALFDAHLEGCDVCAAQIREATAMKRMLSEELTEHPVPRSFRLTPAMIADAAPSKKPAATPWWPRAAQAVGGLAVAAFAFFMVVDLSETSNDSFTAQSSAGDDSTSLESAAPEADSGDDSANDTGASEVPSSAAPASEDGEIEIANAEDGDDSTSATADVVNDKADDLSGRSAGEPGSGAPSGGLESTDRSDDSGIDGLLFAQIASIVVALAAAAAYLASRQMGKE